MNEQYQVYIKTAQGRVIAVNSSAFISDTEHWMQIDTGAGDRFHHAQGNYFDKPLISENGTHNFICENGAVREAAKEEKAAELASFPAPPPTAQQRLAATESALIALMEGLNNV